jgi:diphthine methyl ester synthase
LRATTLGIEVKVIHNASIISAVGCCGLQVYRFGETVSVPLWNPKWKPDSWYQKILQNRRSDLHTLVLVDIKVKERTEENILKDKKIYEPPKFMTIQECVQQLLETEENRKEGAYSRDTPCIGLARVGYSNQRILSGPMEMFLSAEMGPPLHSFVICGQKLHHVEQEMYQHFSK